MYLYSLQEERTHSYEKMFIENTLPNVSSYRNANFQSFFLLLLQLLKILKIYPQRVIIWIAKPQIED